MVSKTSHIQQNYNESVQMYFFPKNLHTLTVLGIYQSGLSAGQNTFNQRYSFGIPHSWYLTQQDPRKVWYIYPPPLTTKETLKIRRYPP